MTRLLLATAGALVLGSEAAWVECGPESWQDCAGKP
jgi:hypothetical protein